MNRPSSSFSGLNLRRLWPAVSEGLYPDAQKSVRAIQDDVKALAQASGDCPEQEQLTKMLDDVLGLLERHFSEIRDVTLRRLNSYPYGMEQFTSGYFDVSCELLSVTAAELKTTWNKARLLARNCVMKSRNSPQEKLILAKLNSVEQDILYLLFVERQYMYPLILRSAEG